MAIRNLYKPAGLESVSDEGADGRPAGRASFQSQIGESRRQSSVLLVSNYSPETNSFTSKTRLGAKRATSESEPDHRMRWRRRSSSFGRYVAHAFAAGSKTNCLFGCLLLLNLLMSAMNTVFLSLLVKSVQLSDLSLLTSSGQRALDWNTRLAGLELSLATCGVGANSTLSVQSIESFESRPLIISSSSSSSPHTGHNQRKRPILISARRPEVGESGRANQLAIGATGEPVEIVANNMVWDQVTNQQQVEAASGDGGGGGGGGELKKKQPGELKAQAARRLLELDGGQQSIALASWSQLKLVPAEASSLLVRAELDAQQSELSGTLEADLDVQSQRHGDLLCESRHTLRLVSRSGRLNLAARQSLQLEAGRLQLDAKRLHLAGGVEFLDEQAGDDIEESPGDAGQPAGQLGAFQLALVGTQLLAAD